MVMYKRPELDTVNPPGQIRNEVTLGDYIARKNYHDAFDKVAEELGVKKKKLSFNEWLTVTYGGINALPAVIKSFMEAVWKAAQENM